jgi:hypothetical protein
METKFQTSFIPKKPVTFVGGAGTNFVPKQRPRPTINIFFNIGLLLFIVSICTAGGVYIWKNMMNSSQENLKQQLVNRQKQFNPDLIEELKRINVKIDLANKIMSNHLALSNVFGIISQMTSERVRFNNLDLSAPGSQGNDIKISMGGVGADLSAVAFQSDVLGQLDQYGLRKIVKDPILSDPTLETTGLVSFSLSASIDPTTLSYASSLMGSTTALSSPF